jgi:flagellar L-ring protein FlgH
MMDLRKKIFTLLMPLSLLSCSVVDRFHNDIDYSMNKNAPTQRRDNIAAIKEQAMPTHAAMSSSVNKSAQPSIKRNYDSPRRRVTPEDLNDNGADGSLWADNNNTQYLFNLKEKKKLGDIIMLNVLDDLKKEISLELNRAFPPKAKAPTQATTSKTKPDQQPVATPNEAEAETVIYDRISTVLIEEVNTEHVLLRGKKNVLFRGDKRDVEIQALVRKDSINEQDTIDSDKVIESSIKVIR